LDRELDFLKKDERQMNKRTVKLQPKDSHHELSIFAWSSLKTVSGAILHSSG